MMFETSINYYPINGDLTDLQYKNGSININYQYDDADTIYCINLPFNINDTNDLEFKITTDQRHDLMMLLSDFLKSNKLSMSKDQVYTLLSTMSDPLINYIGAIKNQN